MLFATVNQDVYGEGTSYTSPFYSSRNAVVPSDTPYNEDGAGTAILSATVIVIHYYLQLTTINVNMLIVLSTLFMANMNLLKT